MLRSQKRWLSESVRAGWATGSGRGNRTIIWRYTDALDDLRYSSSAVAVGPDRTCGRGVDSPAPRRCRDSADNKSAQRSQNCGLTL